MEEVLESSSCSSSAFTIGVVAVPVDYVVIPAKASASSTAAAATARTDLELGGGGGGSDGISDTEDSLLSPSGGERTTSRPIPVSMMMPQQQQQQQQEVEQAPQSQRQLLLLESPNQRTITTDPIDYGHRWEVPSSDSEASGNNGGRLVLESSECHPNRPHCRFLRGLLVLCVYSMLLLQPTLPLEEEPYSYYDPTDEAVLFVGQSKIDHSSNNNSSSSSAVDERNLRRRQRRQVSSGRTPIYFSTTASPGNNPFPATNTAQQQQQRHTNWHQIPPVPRRRKHKYKYRPRVALAESYRRGGQQLIEPPVYYHFAGRGGASSNARDIILDYDKEQMSNVAAGRLKSRTPTTTDDKDEDEDDDTGGGDDSNTFWWGRKETLIWLSLFSLIMDTSYREWQRYRFRRQHNWAVLQQYQRSHVD